ncbi:alpha/beta fold hydrolase [Actinomycetospora straminea]|uniref:AB hydrolase-1 domain-containing protein n=1 Tax=Actinomycetospora straminea TaxID=663607 RepID=A0ABP9ELG2_9PSEU|nr:alpha/beta hydrolase [Actinomycetospora straminea]MDD7933124.1 alpha/beta hydrolase [Actinomycetospora straminea]
MISPSPAVQSTSSTGTATSRDGTVLRTWSNGADGVPLVISNGLGAPPAAWPRLATPDCGFAAVSWSHRGLGGSGRPADPARVRVEDHADDLEATMDAAGVERALLLGWSLGVDVAFEFARDRPHRVAGILGIGGLPGRSFRAFGPPGVPGVLREQAGRTAAWLLRLVGPPAAALAAPTVAAARSLGARHVPPLPDPGASAEVARHFVGHDWTRYSELLLAGGEHPAVDTGSVSFPVTLVGGTLDVAAAAVDICAVAGTIPQARFVPLVGTHFLPLEQPDRLHRELLALADRAGSRPPR